MLTVSDQDHSKNIGWSTPLPKGIKEASDWLTLIPYGIFRCNPRGVQKLAKPDAKEVVHHFNSLGGLFSRHFSGLPVNTEYDTLCGSVSHLEVRDSAMWGLIEWNEEGEKFLADTPTSFIAPIWMTRLEDTDVHVPFKLFEFILSHKSNIPVQPLTTNTKSKTKLNKKSLTKNLAGKRPLLTKNSRDKFLTLVNDHMVQTDCTYLESWQFVKNNNPELYCNIVDSSSL